MRQLVGVLGEQNAGGFETANEDARFDPDRVDEYMGRLKALAVDTGVPVTFGMFSSRQAPNMWQPFFRLADDTAAAGERMFIQVHSRPLDVVLLFETTTPFDKLPVWSDFRKLLLAEQEAGLRDPDMRGRLVAAVRQAPRRSNTGIGAEARAANFKWLFVIDAATPPYRQCTATTLTGPPTWRNVDFLSGCRTPKSAAKPTPVFPGCSATRQAACGLPRRC